MLLSGPRSPRCSRATPGCGTTGRTSCPTGTCPRLSGSRWATSRRSAGRAGELLPEFTNRGLSTLARGVYGYSLAYLLTGEERYLTYAKAGLDWINTKAKDPVHGGYYGELDVDGDPVDPLANKDIFDLGSLGLAYGMYFNVTRDPAAEADLLAVRDLIFDKYYDAATTGSRTR